MKPPIDISKFRKTVAKSIPGLSQGFNDPKTWLSTGCYALNYLICGDFNGGIPLEGKFTMFAGDSGCLPETATVYANITHEIMGHVFERAVTVGELRKIWFTGEYSILLLTPDGFQKVISWWDKGVLPMVSIDTKKHSTRCATNHLIERYTGQDDRLEWVPAANLENGDMIFTQDGPAEVISVQSAPDEECYDFEIDHPNHRYYGDGISSHNSGKSFIVSGNIIKDAQSKGVYPVLIDTENAMDETWLKALDVNTAEDALHKISGATVDDVAASINAFIDQYRAENGSLPYAERPKMIFIIDSLGMLITPANEAQFAAGNMVGDMGIKAKQITQLIRVTMAKIANQPIGLVATNHVMDSQDKYAPDKIPGGKMLEFASSVIVQMNKYLLKEDEDGKALASGQVAGIRSTAVVRKSRYAKPFERIKLDIPYDKGMNPYSGLFDLFLAKGVVEKDGMRYVYTSPVTGEVLKDYRKNFRPNGWLDQIVSEWAHWENAPVKTDLGDPEGSEPDLVEE